MCDAIRRAVFTDLPTGAAHLRWPSEFALPTSVQGESVFGVLGFLKQTIKTDQQSGWIEAGTSLHFYIVRATNEDDLLNECDKRRLMNGLTAATIRVKPESADELVAMLVDREQSLRNTLRRPTDNELEIGVRHGVTPILAAIVATDE